MLEQTDALFIPVFYDVEPWELRHIENFKSRYAVAFSHYRRKGRNLDKLDEWKNALVSAADISGYELRQHKDNLCEKIVSRVLQVVQEKKNWVPLDVAKYPVGLAELIKDFESSCSEPKKDMVTRVGIIGLGGSGKTTLAKEFFNRKRSGYHTSCFLSDVRESHAKGELHRLQSQLLKDIFPKDPENEGLEIRSVHHGTGKLKDRLGRARHLHFMIILDDIDHEDQLDALLPEGMLSSGSMVIITTRDQSVLTGTDIRYRMKGLNRDHAKDLFCSHAFRGRVPPIAYEKLVDRFVKFCGGLPLSLKVLGAHVYGRNEYYWELEMEKVKKIQPKDIMQRLKISFDGLDKEEKQIFIDIACFFNKNSKWNIEERAIQIWKASGWSGEHAVQTLQDKCLLEVRGFQASGLDYENYKFEMHDHLRDLGRHMADDMGSPRLWRPDILRSMEAKGFKQILAETKGRCFHSFKDSSLKTTITYFIGSLYDSAETDLLLLEIGNDGGKFKDIPSWIPLQKLHYLSVYNAEELWSTFQQQLQITTQASFESRMPTICDSPSLQKLPDLIGMFSHLEELEIRRCLQKTDITSFVQSLKQLSNLRSLKLWNSFCGNLHLSKGRDSTNLKASTSSRMNSLETIEFGELNATSKLLISGEICPRLRSLKVERMGNLNEMDLQQLERLNTLIVWDCPKMETFSGLSSLTGLQFIQLLACTKLETISGLSSLTGLQFLDVIGCPKFETTSWLSSLTGLQVFKADYCQGFKSLPTFAHLRHLERITILGCHQLKSVEGVEELQGLKSLVIEMPDDGYAWVRNCIYGLRRLPSEYTVLTGKAVEAASSRLNVNLFSEVIGSQAVAEIGNECLERDRGESILKMRSSSSAITIYALLVTPTIGRIEFEGKIVSVFGNGEWMITVLVTPHNSNGRLSGVSIEKGFVATVNEGEEGKALTVLQTIADRLYRQSKFAVCDVGTDESMVPKLAAYDVVKRKRKRKY